MTNINSYSNSYNNYSSKSISSTSTSANAVTEKDLETQLKEFEAFKAQNYKEVEAIINSSSSKWSSGSIEVTAGALLRMQSDPAFKDEMMRLLQEDADATHNWTKSGESHIKIDENGYTGHSKSFLGEDLNSQLTDIQAKSDANLINALFNNGDTSTEETLDKDQYKSNQNSSLIKKMQVAMNESKEAQKEKTEKADKKKKADKAEEEKKANKIAEEEKKSNKIDEQSKNPYEKDLSTKQNIVKTL